MSKLSVFEVLDFIPDPKKSTTNAPGNVSFHYENLEECVIEAVNNICNQDQPIHIHDAAIFSAYYGIPRDEEKRISWEKLSFGGKVAQIMNDLSASGITSFTKLL